MPRKRSSQARKLPVLWQKKCAWSLPVQLRPAGAQPPEAFFVGLLGLGASLTASLPPIILTEKTSHEYELKKD